MAKVNNGFLTPNEIADKLKVSTSWIYRKCKAGVMPHVRIGGVIRFVSEDIETWISGHKVKGNLKV